MRLEIRTAGDPSELVRPIHDAIAASGSSVHVQSVRPLASVVEASLNQERLLARLALAFGVAALGLVALGLYGVMNYSILRRTGEFGLRVTLGATRHDLVLLIFGEALMLVAIGVIAGIPLAMLAARALRSQLSGITGADPMTMAIAIAVLAGSAICATVGPVLRATRVAPMDVLRTE